MTSPTLARRLGLAGGLAIKAPVRSVSLTNIVLSGLQTVSGVALAPPDRCLVAGQTDATQNGWYDVDSGSWTRSIDANGATDVAKGTIGLITDGTYAGQFYVLNTAGTISFGTTAIAFAVGIPALAVLAAAAGANLIGFLQSGVGALLRTVQAKLREQVSVKDFGAVGNGIADDSAAIVLAVGELVARGGGRLYFPEGTYLLVSAQLPIHSNIHYLGAGQDATIIKMGASHISAFSSWPCAPGASGAVIAAAVIAAPYVDYPAISDMTINGDYNVVADGGEDNFQHGIYLFKCRYALVERVTFKNIWYVGAESFYYTRNNTIRDCRFQNVGDKHTIVSPAGYYYGIGFDNGCAWNKAISNHFENCGHAINMINDFGDSAEGVIIDDNTFKTLSGSFLVGRHGASWLSVTNNHGAGLGDSFVYFYADAGIMHSLGYMRNIRVTGNSVDDYNLNNGASQIGIYVTAYGANIIADNTVAHAVTGAARGIIGIHCQGTPDLAVSTFLTESNDLIGDFPNYQAIRLDLTTNAVVGANKINCKTTGHGVYIAASCVNTTVSPDNAIVDAAVEIDDGSATSRIEGRWVTYNPVMTISGGGFALGNGSLAGHYFRLGRQVTVQATFSVGATTNFGAGGAFLLTTPIASDAAERVGSCLLEDVSATVSASGTSRIRGDGKLDFFGPDQVSNISPFAFAVGDVIMATLTYKSNT